MQPPDQLVAYARQIAIYRAYTNLENGLQPLDVLNAKFEHEQEEFAEAVANKDIWHQYHEAADLLYYAACIDMQNEYGKHSGPFFQVQWTTYQRAFILLHRAGLCGLKNHDKAEKTALAKYGWRASGPGRKDEAYEIELIQQALQ